MPRATVSPARVIAWLAISLLMTLAGILLFLPVLGHITKKSKEQTEKEKHQDLQGLLLGLYDLGFF